MNTKLSFLLFVSLSIAAHGADIQPAGKFNIDGILEENENLSGIATLGGNKALIVADEKPNSGQFIEINPAKLTIQVLNKFPLLCIGGELDAEGVAALDGDYYVVGSHGLSATKGEFQISRYFLIRVSAEGATDKTDSLIGILTAAKDLAPFFMKPLREEKGINLEGLAGFKGRLYAGFRGPNLEGTALVISFDPKKVFKNETDHIVHRIKTGDGVGIRSLAEVEGGLLVLTGIAASEGHIPATVLFWNPATGETKELGTLSGIEGNPETLLVLSTTTTAYQVLVMSDSAVNGDASLYELPR